MNNLITAQVDSYYDCMKLLTIRVLTHRLSVGARGSRAAWKSHTLIALHRNTVINIEVHVSVLDVYLKSSLTRHMHH